MKIFRISNLLILAVAAFFGGILFWTSQSVQQAESELAKLNKAVAHEKETLLVLGAEWDYLNRPDRIEQLAQEHLDLVPPSGGQILRGSEPIPEPVIPVIPKIKPASLGGRKREKPQEETIRKPESKDFNKLMNELSSGGGQR